MKRWFHFLAAIVGTLSLAPVYAQQPVVSVAVESIGLNAIVASNTGPLVFGAGTIFGNASAIPPAILASPLVNESFGPWTSILTIGGFATGTYTKTSYTYTFYVNGLTIGSSTSPVIPPLRDYANWAPPQPGAYTLTVKATDGVNTANSLGVRYYAVGTVVNSPVDNSTIPDGSSVVIKADAVVRPSSIVSQVAFYDNGVLIPDSTDTTLPYSCIYKPAGGVGSPHAITAVATDSDGNILTSAAVSFHVITPAAAGPSCSVTSPSGESLLGVPTTGNSIPILIDAYSASGRISKVELYVDGELFGSTTNYPYLFSWAPKVVGVYKLVALASDDKSNVIASTVRTVTVAPPPSVVIIAPQSGTTVAGGTPIQLTAVASDSNQKLVGSHMENIIVRTVQFFVDSEFKGEATEPVAGTADRYSVSATLTQKTDPDTGAPIPSSIIAIATDSEGISGTSPTVSVSVTTGGGGSSQPPVGLVPTVSVTSPVGGSVLTVNAPVLLTTNAVDSDGYITQVAYYVGSTLVDTAKTYPLNITWTPKNVGTYAIIAKATDNDGNTVSSTAVTVRVEDPGANGGGATISITSPADGASIFVNTAQLLKATPVVNGTIASVQFFVNGQPEGEAVVKYPYQLAWTPTAPGNYAIAARLTTSTGAQATSASIALTVTGGAAPTCTLDSPVAGNLAVNVVQTITASAVPATGTNGPVGSIASVQFFVNGILVSTDTEYPYSVQWTPTSTGQYSIFARATDNLGNTTDSASASVNVVKGAAPTVVITTPATASSYTAGTAITIGGSAADSDGTVTKVQFFVNGVAYGAPSTIAPYSVVWTPAAAGTYVLSAQATDDSGNVGGTVSSVSVTIKSNGAPTVAMTSPKTGTTVSAYTKISLVAAAADADGTVKSVRFFANGSLLGSSTNTPGPFSLDWTPTATGAYSIVAEATDSSGNVANSTLITVTVTQNQAPSAKMATPADGYGTTVGVSVVLSATATDVDGSIASVRFLANGVQVGSTLTTVPYSLTWTPSIAGLYAVVAEVTDNTGNTSTSSAVNVTVIGNIAPTIAITSPANGNAVTVNSVTTIAATAKDPDGTIAKVQFYVNGVAQGSPSTIYPYQISWTPTSEGVYRVYGVVTDNSGTSTTSSIVTVLGVTAAASSSERVYKGTFGVYTSQGKYEIVANSSTATFIGYSTVSGTKTYYFPNLVLDSAGAFSGTDASGQTIAGTVNDTGATVTLKSSATAKDSTLVIGTVTLASTTTFPVGRYIGSLGGVSGSLVDAIIGADGSLIAYISNGTSKEIAAGTLTSTGATNPSTLTGVLLGSSATLTVDLSSGVMGGTISGAISGSVAAAIESGTVYSDGTLRNLSTRGSIGTGNNVLIAGFYISGTTSKQILVRGIGPGLSAFGISDALTSPVLELYSGATLIAANTTWDNDPTLATIMSQVGAFPLSATSRDTALVKNLPPGGYTAILSGVGGATGIGLVELYDVDSATAFTSQKLVNISSRGYVSTGQAQLIAGFVVGGTVSKRVLIRASGPALAANLSSGTLADPKVRLSRSVNNADVLVRENDNWEDGNDPTMIKIANAKVGAGNFASGSKDASILISLAPGAYTAQVMGVNNTSGIALVEVFEVP